MFFLAKPKCIFSIACDVVSSNKACENNGDGRDESADGNLIACIRSQIAKGNQYAVWWKRRCYGTNTCNSPTDLPGTINYCRHIFI